MAKRKESVQVEPEKPVVHPLMNRATAVQELMKRLQATDQANDFKIEQLEEWKKAINRLAATSDGQLLLPAMVQFSGYGIPGDIKNTVKMVEDNGKQAFYLRWVRPYIDKEHRMEIE